MIKYFLRLHLTEDSWRIYLKKDLFVDFLNIFCEPPQLLQSNHD